MTLCRSEFLYDSYHLYLKLNVEYIIIIIPIINNSVPFPEFSKQYTSVSDMCVNIKLLLVVKLNVELKQISSLNHVQGIMHCSHSFPI